VSTRAADLWSFWNELVDCGRDVDRLLGLIARRAAEIVGEGAVIAVMSEDRTLLEPAATFHRDPDIQDLMRRLLGTTPSRVGRGVAGVVAAERRPSVLAEIDAGALAESVEPAYRPFLEQHPIRALAIVPMVAFGEVVGTLGVLRTASRDAYTDEDVVALEALAERAALALADANGHTGGVDVADHEAIFRHSIDGVLFTAPDGRVLAANPAACEILQRTEAEICSLGRRGLVVGDDPRAVRAVETRNVTGRVRAELPMLRGDGTVFIADIASTIFATPSGELRACVIFRDVSEQVAMREELERTTAELARLAEQDELTKLRNRRGYHVAGNQALAFADREGVPIQLAFFDLDGLKQINDAHGHQLGDAVLAKLGAAIALAARAVDVVARLGGDEFVALLYGATRAEAERIVERIADAVAEEDGLPPLSFTVGIAERLPGDDATLDDLLSSADDRMYARKSAKHDALRARGGAPAPTAPPASDR
jgi:diguanylate cyclase (GGDEF)-like protein/PAS domain S-box-containing protein